MGRILCYFTVKEAILAMYRPSLGELTRPGPFKDSPCGPYAVCTESG